MADEGLARAILHAPAAASLELRDVLFVKVNDQYLSAVRRSHAMVRSVDLDVSRLVVPGWPGL